MGRKALTVFLVFLSLFFLRIQPAASERAHQAQVVRVAFYDGFPPFQYIDAEGNAAGMHIEILNEMTKKRHMQVEYLPFATKEQ